MLFWHLIFWIGFSLVFYNYAGYAIILYLYNKLWKPQQLTGPSGSYRPSVSFVVAAYNEEDCIESKILNSLGQDYPKDLIEYIFITDGSSDQTPDIVRKYENIKLLHQPERKGKSAALNRAVQNAGNDILIFSDANTVLNADAVSRIAAHYRDQKVGGVAGEKKVLSSADNAEVGSSEGLYWKYESFLKKIDSDFYSVVGAAGELFSLRRSLYEAVGDQVILDDFIISMGVSQKGYRVVYEPMACAMELPSFSIKDEQKRKIRIAAGGFQAMGILKPLLQVWKQPRLSFLYISHRVLRWTTSPVCLILVFISNIFLFREGQIFYQVSMMLQIGFYLMALAARFIPLKIFRLAYYFVFMNISVIQGFFRFMKGNQPAAWEKVKRSYFFCIITVMIHTQM